MNGFSKSLEIATAVIVFFLLLVAADLWYVLLWRRRFHSLNTAASDASGDPYTSPSKELLYFLCWKAHSRVEPADVPSPTDGATSFSAPPSPNGDLLKSRGLHGPRFLFTITEEKEESEAEEEKKTLTECFSSMTEDVEIVVEVTPFMTPCASPPFYTPMSSPLHGAEEVAGKLMQLTDTDDREDVLPCLKSSGVVCISVD